MIVEYIKNTTVITQEKATFSELVSKINNTYTEFSNNNIIVNLFSLNQLLKEYRQ